MARLHAFLRGLRALVRPRRDEQELDEELRHYLERSIEQKMAAGASREEAARAARLEMGGLEPVKDAVREAGWEFALETLWRDVRFGGRLLRRNPGFAVVAVAALALGIGANTAIFSVVNAVLLAPLPFERPDRLAMVWERSPHTGSANVVNPRNFLEWRARNRSFAKMAALIAFPRSLAGDGEPEQVDSLAVSDGFFEILGARPLLGRWFTPAEDRPGSDHVVILAEGLWRRRYAGDRTIVGRTIRVDNQPVQVVGVMPASFKFPFGKTDVWLPLGINPASESRGRYLSTIARLRDGVSLAQAQADMAVLGRRLREERPKFNAKWGVQVVGLRQQVVGDVRTPLLILLGAVGLVLLIACANVANLLLMRASGRRREIAVRAALGASGIRLMRQFLVESALLAGSGGLLGLLLGLWGMRALTAALPDTIAYANLRTVRIDSTVLLFTAAVSAATTILFGLVPAMRAGRHDLQGGLREGARGFSSPRSRVRAALVLAEVALAMMLAVGAGLLIRSFARVAAVDPGFDAAHVLTMRINTSGFLQESDPRFLEFCARLLQQVRALPGVEAAGTSHFLPLGRIIPATGFWRADRPKPAPGEQPVTEVLVVTPGYFAAMKIPLVRGRVLAEQDRKGAPLAVVVNQALARSMFPGENPVGRPLGIEWGSTELYTIAGVVGDVRQQKLQEPSNPALFVSNLQQPTSPVNLVARIQGDPLRLEQAMRAIVHGLNGNIPVSDVRTMNEDVSASVALPRFQTILLGAFSALAVLLAAVGIFGVSSYSVAQRTRELGIRRALGADEAGVMRLVFSQGLLVAGAGVGLGGIGALWLTRLLRKLLYEVEPTDPATFFAAAGLLALVALAACYVPARRAARVDPARILRIE